ncbi:electron transport complex subunit C, partial [Pectobacterium carotovorum subsp. carotovorum]
GDRTRRRRGSARTGRSA